MMENQVVLKIPKIKVDEILFVAYTTPAPITRTAPLDERETVVYRVLPDDLAEKLRELHSGFEGQASKCLKPVVSGRLYCIRYPLAKYKPILEKLIEEWNQKYETFADELYSRRAEVEKMVADFYTRHNVDRETLRLDPDYLRERFRVNTFMVPLSLHGSGVLSQTISEEEWRRITADAKQRVTDAYRQSMNEGLEDFFSSLQKLLGRLNSGKMIAPNSLQKLHRLYNEALEGMAVTQDDRYAAPFDVMEKVLDKLAKGRERHVNHRDNRQMAASIVADTLNATKQITTNARPVLEEFQTVLEATRRPTKKQREGIKDVLDNMSTIFSSQPAEN